MYGLQELNTFMPRCSADRYHVPPWLMLLPLDQAGEKNTYQMPMKTAPLCSSVSNLPTVPPPCALANKAYR
jgi:hypothetical protein